jgi:phenylacetate-CoA ligase
MHYGAELLGLVVIPVSGGNTERQVMLLQDFGATVIACTPSYALTLAEALAARGIRPGGLPLRYGVLGAEPWTEAMRDEIEKKLGITAVNIYGLSEVIGPGVSNECVEAKDGAHIFEDHFLVEAINPLSGDSLPPGTTGELVFTTLTKEALPVIRYRSGDLASLNPTRCRCGRTHVRMSRVLGRTDDMLIIRGVNVYPTQVEAALVNIPELSPHYQLVISRDRTLDEMEVKVEISEAFQEQHGAEIAEGSASIQALVRQCQQKLAGVLGLTVSVNLVAPGKLPRSEGGKLRRVIDRRAL